MPLSRPVPIPRYSHTKGRRPPYRKTTRKELTPLQRAFVCGFLEAGGSGREITRRFDIPHNTALRVLKTARAKAEELGVGLVDGRCYETRERGHRARREGDDKEGGGGEGGQGVSGEEGETGRGGEGKGVIRVKSHMQGGCLIRGYVRKRPGEDAERGGRGNKKKVRTSSGIGEEVIDPSLQQGELQGMEGGTFDVGGAGMSDVDFASLYAATNGHHESYATIHRNAP
ncbi:hypothetical protein B0A48_02705 [Cryoendolithus antarcticus]|uniref:Uncharacterized protein n=1 Tax=Cryoendolithus antarcticus TaxID=1507870 RepID=A0A1V8TL21_9PEZI|nr:hypothetical protein B0A48_02705 [Cryoendolithus antarcticus]